MEIQGDFNQRNCDDDGSSVISRSTFEESPAAFLLNFDLAQAARSNLELEICEKHISVTRPSQDRRRGTRIILDLPCEIDVDRVSSTLLAGQVMLHLPKVVVENIAIVA